ncbi:MAG TPA: bifunctional hydroxymethylpyrimidine kinase/phosphomethylpyrimidine kinase [Candidatus Baltobacteraceae bacterium]|nr:bifunctional hydroxymethylpyrimidine kinase/phosphomethylpyrimidine kinase [Candidatus Baltobacteraceae bacterium]
MNRDDVQNYPLIGSIQNTVGMGFIGNQALFAIANALGARTICAPTTYASAHSGFSGRSNWTVEPQQFRKDVAFLVSQQPALLIIGYVPRPNLVDIVATQLTDYKGVVLLDPVIGDYQKGLYVTTETARAIRDQLMPIAQIVTPNRFEAEVLLGSGADSASELAFLNGLFDLGPQAVIVTSYERDPEKHRVKTLFTNGYSYYRIGAPYYPTFPAHGVGDAFAGAAGVFMALGASPFAAALLASALCARAVANTSAYGGATIDPVAALEKWRPLGYQVDDERTMLFCQKSMVESEAIKPTAQDGARLKFAPPKNKIIYG